MDNLEKILEIKVDANSAIKTMADLSKSYQDLKNHEKELQNEIKELSKDEAANAEVLQRKREELIATKEQEKQYSGQISELSRVVQNQLNLDKEQVGSLKSLRAELSNATKEYDSLSRAEREGAKGKELQKHINEVTDELKNAEEGTQRYQRNVGNYENAIKSALSAQSGFAGGLIDIATKSGGVSGAMKTAGQAVSGFGKQLLALLANPIVLIISGIALAVKGVVDAFKSSEEQTQGLKKAFAPVTAVLDIVKKGFQELAAVVVKAVEGIMSAVNWIARNVASLFGLEDAYNAVNAEAQRYIELQEREYELTKRTREAQVQDAQDELKVSELRVKAKDKETQTDEERLAAMMEANAIEEGIAKRRKELAEEAYEIAAGKAALTENDKETNDELARLEAEKYKAEKDYNNKRRELLSEENAIRNEIAAKEKKRHEEERKRIEEQIKKRKEYNDLLLTEQRKAQEALISLMKDGAEKETALENARFEKSKATLQAKLDAEKKNHGEDTELYAVYAAQMEALVSEHQGKLEKISLAGRKKEIEQTMQTMQMKLDLIKNNLDEEFDIKRQMLDKTLELELSKTEYTEEQKALIRKKYAADIIALEEQKRIALEEQTNLEWSNRIEAAKFLADEYLNNSLEALNLEVEQTREQLDNLHQYEFESDAEYKARLLAAQKNYLDKKKQLADAEMQIEKAKLSATADMAGSLSELLDTTMSENKNAVALSKVLALAEVAINQGIAISEAIASAAAGDPYTYALRVAAAITSTITAMAKAISSIKSAKFSKGTGYVTYPGTKESDGDVVPALLTPGEAVATVKANKMFPGLVQAMNDVAAGVSTPARVFNSSNVVNNYTSQSTLNEIAENTEKRLVVSVEEIHRVEDNVEAIENLSTL